MHTRDERGVVSIEFALIIPIFLTLIFMWAEICFMSYVSSLGDFAISQTARSAKANLRRDEGTAAYAAAIESALNTTTFGKYFSGKFSVDVRYLKSTELNQLSKACGYEVDADTGSLVNTCQLEGYTTGEARPVAVYRISYNYTPIFASLIFSGDAVFDREVIAVQEYERCDFDITGTLTCDISGGE